MGINTNLLLQASMLLMLLCIEILSLLIVMPDACLCAFSVSELISNVNAVA